MAVMPRLSLALLGTFQASAGNRPVANFATDKSRALLAYLVVEADRPHRRDALAALLWPHWDDSGARGNLRQTLHRLRETLDAAAPALSDDLFGITRETIQVNATAVEVDVARFLSLLETCESHPHRLLHLCPSCLDQLGEAAALYSGELLAGLSIDGAPGFDQWELTRREELGQRVLKLLYRLSDAFEQLGDYDRGLMYAHRQLALDPFREEAHSQVMRCYALRGDRAAALAHFDRARRLLADELGVTPDRTMTDLAGKIRAGTFAGARAEGRPLLHHFPARFTPFFGRATEIARLVERMTSDELRVTSAEGSSLVNSPSRLLTIIAPGGMGKTRLAIAAAEALAERPGYPDGIYFASLAHVVSADLLPSALAAALGMNLGAATDRLIAHLSNRRLLLVLDNFEHLLDGIDLLLWLLEGAPGVRLLVTSREALNVRAEERFYLGGLDEAAATALFVGTAARLRPGHAPSPADIPAIRAIIHDVGGLPLAVELAATWTRVMAVRDMAARIRSDLDFLSTTLRDLPERQRSMRLVFDQMWATLTPPEREALAMLSVLRGSFRLDAAEAISGASPAVVASLLDQSLLAATGSGWFELHELLRQYAAERAVAAAIDHPAAERHAAHYLALLGRRGAALGGPESKDALAVLLRNLDNIRAAWKWVLGDSSPGAAVPGIHLEAIARATPALRVVFRFSGLLLEGAAAFDAAAAALEAGIEDGRLAPQKAYPIVYDLVEAGATLLDLGGHLPEALERLEKARAGWEALGDRRRVGRVMSDMGQAYVRTADMAEARRILDPALAMARELGDGDLIASVLHNQGTAAIWSGDLAGGRALLEETVAYYRAAGDRSLLVGALCDLAAAHVLVNELETGWALYGQSLSIAEAIGDGLGALMARTGLGWIALDLGDLVAAERYSWDALAMAQDLGEQRELHMTLCNLGHIALAGGDRAGARQYYTEVVAIKQAAGLDIPGEVLVGLASLATADEPAAAAKWLAAVEAWRRARGYGPDIPFLARLTAETEGRLRAALDEAAFAAAWAAGSALSLAAAAHEAMAWASGEWWVAGQSRSDGSFFADTSRL